MGHYSRLCGNLSGTSPAVHLGACKTKARIVGGKKVRLALWCGRPCPTLSYMSDMFGRHHLLGLLTALLAQRVDVCDIFQACPPAA